jgi:hypothetical protein
MTRKRERDKDSLLRRSEVLTAPRGNKLLEKALVLVIVLRYILLMTMVRR